jgi:A/G-specific adenine glycosylase
MLSWFEENARIFPWRSESLTAYEIIISETLLQRTKAETVAKFYSDFLIKYPDWKTLAETKLEIIESDLKPLGLNKQRAKRIKELAIELVKRNGVLPSTRLELDEISMFGQYIANAIELQIFNRPKPLIDVNMARVLERYFGPRQLSDIRYDRYLQELSHKVANHQDSKLISWAILDFAALVCKSRKPLCTECILKTNCKYFSWLIN